MKTDEELISRALKAGWTWKSEDTAPYGMGWKDDHSGFFPTLEVDKASRLRIPDGKGFDHDFDCQYCSKPIWLSWMKSCEKELIAEKACFHCNHFAKLLRIDTTKTFVIQQGVDTRTHYTDAGMVKTEDQNHKRMFLGFGGTVWNIQRPDGSIVTTNNLWCQGDIPKHLWDKFPISGVMLTENDLRRALEIKKQEDEIRQAEDPSEDPERWDGQS